VIAQDRLHLTPEWIGIMASMDGVGAFIGATVIALFIGPRFYARTYLCGVTSYMLMLPIFALASRPITAGAALLLTGIGGAAFSIMQATQVYLAAPPAMRSRVLGVLSVCIGIGPIGFVHLGFLGDGDDGDRGVGGVGADIPLVARHSDLMRAGSRSRRPSRSRSARPVGGMRFGRA
jgi:MFS family permease